MRTYQVLSLLAAGVIATGAIGQTSDPSFIKIDQFTYNGGGCPPGSLAYNLSPDREAVTLLFSTFQVSTDAVSTLGCSVAMELTVPPGWQYAVFSVDTRGYAQMTPGAAGFHTTSYQFNGGPLNNLGVSQYSGPYDNDYFDHEEINLTANNWSPCNNNTQPLALYLQMGVSGAAGAQGLMTIDSADGQLAHEVGIRWRHCPSTDWNRRYVEQLYADVLGRWAADWEINGWVAQVGPANRDTIALGFLKSPEHRTHEVAADYITYLGRQAAPAEIQAQGAQFARGVTTDQMIVGLTSSPEFYARFGSTPQGFVTGLYVLLLGRVPAPAEVARWVPEARRDRAAVARLILLSPESRLHQVSYWYQRYLGRPGSPAEWQGWTAQMTRADASEYIQSRLIGSPEYFTRPR